MMEHDNIVEDNYLRGLSEVGSSPAHMVSNNSEGYTRGAPSGTTAGKVLGAQSFYVHLSLIHI